MFVKKGEEKDYWLQCSRKELFDEFLSQTTIVLERIGIDANLLAYDVAMELRDNIVSFVSRKDYARKMFYSLYFSLQRFPRASLALTNFILLR